MEEQLLIGGANDTGDSTALIASHSKGGGGKDAAFGGRCAPPVDGFRLLLSTEGLGALPPPLVAHCRTVALGRPTGVRSAMSTLWARPPLGDRKWVEDAADPAHFKAALFALTFAHALLQTRGNFGAPGWAGDYAFGDAEADVMLTQLKLHVGSAAGDGAWKVVEYVARECVYGGRVLDDWDRRVLGTIVGHVLQADVVFPGTTLLGRRRSRGGMPQATLHYRPRAQSRTVHSLTASVRFAICYMDGSVGGFWKSTMGRC